MLHPPWKELYDTYKEAPYGAFLSFGEISSVCKIPLYGHGWTFTVERFKKEMLRVNSKAVVNVRNKGYRIVNPNEHPGLVYRETRRAERRIRHGVDLTVHVDYEQLTDTEKHQMTDLATRMMTLNTLMVKGVKRIKGVTLHYDLPGVPRPQITDGGEHQDDKPQS